MLIGRKGLGVMKKDDIKTERASLDVVSGVGVHEKGVEWSAWEMTSFAGLNEHEP